MSEEFLTVTEAAQKLGVSPRTVQRYCKQGRLNHKWINGKRHKELRILPPIPIAQLPGARRRTVTGTFDYITREDFEERFTALQRKFEERGRKIAVLEEQIHELKSTVRKKGAAGTALPEADLKHRFDEYVHEFEQVRPTEKKLILKMAQMLQDHEEYFRSHGSEES